MIGDQVLTLGANPDAPTGAASPGQFRAPEPSHHCDPYISLQGPGSACYFVQTGVDYFEEAVPAAGMNKYCPWRVSIPMRNRIQAIINFIP